MITSLLKISPLINPCVILPPTFFRNRTMVDTGFQPVSTTYIRYALHGMTSRVLENSDHWNQRPKNS